MKKYLYIAFVLLLHSGCNSTKNIEEKLETIEQTLADMQVALVKLEIRFYEKENVACLNKWKSPESHLECMKETTYHIGSTLPPAMVRTFRVWKEKSPDEQKKLDWLKHKKQNEKEAVKEGS